jgi:hypothetical protein
VNKKESFKNILCHIIEHFEQIIFHVDNFWDMEKYSLGLEWNIRPCHPTSLMETIIVFSF